MRLPITVRHQYSNLSRITPKVAFPLTLPTSPQRQTLSPSPLQFRASSSSDNEKSDFYMQLRRLARSQKTLEDLEAKGDVWSDETFQRLEPMTLNEVEAIWDQRDAAEQEQVTNVLHIWERVTRESHAESRNSSGSRRGLGISQLVEEMYAEPLARLTPDELKLVDRAFRVGQKAVRNTVLKTIFRGAVKLAKLAASLGFAYWLFRYLSAN